MGEGNEAVKNDSARLTRVSLRPTRPRPGYWRTLHTPYRKTRYVDAMTKDPTFDADAARQARLAAALRANLLRRKLRDRAASQPPEDNDPAAD